MPNDASIVAERLILFGAAVGSLIALALGVTYSERFHDPHMMNRAGAAVVVLQVLAALAESKRRQRLEHLRGTIGELNSGIESERSTTPTHGTKVRILETEIRRSESHAVAIVLSLAAIGEFFHGFGDLVIEHFLP